ncbi:MAG: hypothetical protein ACR2QC_07700 [Gammaproteobacteria bacterium]
MSLYGSVPKASAVVGTVANANLTDNSGGAASDTIAVIGATYDQAEVRNAVASLAAKVNALQTELRKVNSIK